MGLCKRHGNSHPRGLDSTSLGGGSAINRMQALPCRFHYSCNSATYRKLPGQDRSCNVSDYIEIQDLTKDSRDHLLRLSNVRHDSFPTRRMALGATTFAFLIFDYDKGDRASPTEVHCRAES